MNDRPMKLAYICPKKKRTCRKKKKEEKEEKKKKKKEEEKEEEEEEEEEGGGEERLPNTLLSRGGHEKRLFFCTCLNRSFGQHRSIFAYRCSCILRGLHTCSLCTYNILH